jgi:hypothetical protein
MIRTRWIIHCEMCGFLLRPEYPAQWMPHRLDSYRFHHKRDAIRVIAEYSRNVREHMFIEPERTETDAVFD